MHGASPVHDGEERKATGGTLLTVVMAGLRPAINRWRRPRQLMHGSSPVHDEEKGVNGCADQAWQSGSADAHDLLEMRGADHRYLL